MNITGAYFNSFFRWVVIISFKVAIIAPFDVSWAGAQTLTDSLWAEEQLVEETREDVPPAAERVGPRTPFQMGYSLLAEPGPRQARMHLDIGWQPSAWIYVKASVVRQQDEPLLFRLRQQWFAGEHSMAFVELKKNNARLVLGDFRFRSAALVSDFTARSLAASRVHPARSAVRSMDVMPYAGAAEGPAPRGAGAVLPLTSHVRILAFASRRRERGTDGHLSGPLSALGFGLGTDSRYHDASISWSRFRSGTGSLSWLEGGLSAHVPPLPVRASMAFAVRDAKRAHVRIAEVTWTLPAASVTLWRHHVPRWDISPWGPGSRLEDRDHTRLARGLSVRSRVGSGSWLAAGFARRTDKTRTEDREALHRSEVFARFDHPRIVAEWRVIVDDRDALTALPPDIRIRTVEAIHRQRASLTLRGQSGPGWNWALRGLASESHALSAQLRRVWKRRTLVLTRAVTWGESPEAWAVIYTDRMPGRLGLVRAVRPRTVQMARFDIRGAGGQQFSLAASLDTDVETRHARFTWGLSWRR